LFGFCPGVWEILDIEEINEWEHLANSNMFFHRHHPKSIGASNLDGRSLSRIA
jgi:hypothetical protein